MTDTLLNTKFHIPQVSPRAIRRERLLDCLVHVTAGKLTLVSAPAGFGKTTLVSMWARKAAKGVAWLSLDVEDNDPARFLAYLLAACQRVDDRIGVDARVTFQSLQSASPEAILTDLLNDLAASDRTLFLVLDDYHLIENQQIHDAMIFMLDHLPAQMHLVLVTRADPPFPLPRLRSRGFLAEIRQNDLRFTTAEAAGYLNKAMGLGLSMKDIQALENRTEGWIAGLHLAALSLSAPGPDPANKTAFVRAFTGSHRYVLDYLVEEVLDQQPPALQSFLLDTAFLKRMCGPLCDAVIRGSESDHIQGEGPNAGLSDLPSQSILEHLEAANLFIVPLDEERRWFRYHRLFADLLQQRLLRLKPDALPELHRRASRWFQDAGLIPEAIDHALAAEEYDRAGSLIAQVAERTLMRSQLATLLRWIDAIPAVVLPAHPSLCVYRAWALLLSGCSIDTIESCLVALDRQTGDVSGEVAALDALIALFQGDLNRVEARSELALEHLPQRDIYLRGFAQWLFGVARLLSGDWDSSHQELDRLVRTSQETGNVMLAVMVMCNLAELYAIQGYLHKAVGFYRQALTFTVDRAGEPLPIAGEAMIGLGEICRERNDLEAAEKYIQEGIALGKKWSQTGIFEGYIYLAYLRFAQGDLEGVRKAVQEAWQLARQFDATELDDQFVAAHEANLWVMQGNLSAAERWIADQGLTVEICLEELQSRLDKSTPISHRRRTQEHFTFIRILQRQGRYEDALAILDLLLQIAEKFGLAGRRIKVDIQQALIHQAQGNLSLAAKLLSKALVMAEPEGFRRVFLDEGEPMARLLRQALRLNILPGYVHSLLESMTLQDAVVSGAPPGIMEPLSERELEVLRLLGAGMSNPEIAAELVVAVSTVRSHCKNIYGKLDVHSRWDAVQRARNLGYL